MSEAAAVRLDELCRCGAVVCFGGPQSCLGEPCSELRLDRNSSRSGVTSDLKPDARAPSLMRNMHCCFAPLSPEDCSVQRLKTGINMTVTPALRAC